MRTTRPVALLLAVAATAAGCSTLFRDGVSPPPVPARFSAIDEVRGSYGGVAVGDGRRRMFDVFGRRAPVGEGERALPSGAPEGGVDGPNGIPAVTWYCYTDVCFWFDDRLTADGVAPGTKIQGFELTSPGARTLRGIEVGDHLDDVKKAYPELECGEISHEGFGDYGYCTGEVAPDRYIWFGGDTVNVITVGAIPLG